MKENPRMKEDERKALIGQVFFNPGKASDQALQYIKSIATKSLSLL
jgi:hypothetical protein